MSSDKWTFLSRTFYNAATLRTVDSFALFEAALLIQKRPPFLRANFLLSKDPSQPGRLDLLRTISCVQLRKGGVLWQSDQGSSVKTFY